MNLGKLDRVLLVVCNDDIASKNIYSEIKEYLKNYPFIETLIIDDLHIFHDLETDADLVIFLSRHSSKAKIASLTVHCIGNFKKSELGGKDNTLVLTNAVAITEVLRILKKHENEVKSEITFEASHHGPWVNKPSFFVEIGSTETEWKNENFARIWKETLLEFFNKVKNKMLVHDKPTAIYIGGLHYSKATNFIDKYNIGHICAKYNFPINEYHIVEMLEKTLPKPDVVLVEKKGVKNRANLIDPLKKLQRKYDFKIIMV